MPISMSISQVKPLASSILPLTSLDVFNIMKPKYKIQVITINGWADLDEMYATKKAALEDLADMPDPVDYRVVSVNTKADTSL